jgi:hypothetical protein
MSKVHGRFGRLAVSDDAGATYVDLGEIISIDPGGALDEVETTTHQSGPVREYLKGRRDLSFDVAAFWNQDDPGQLIVKTAYYGDTNLFLRLRDEEGSGRDEWLDLDAFSTNFSKGSPNDDAATLDITFRVTGVHSPSAQP